MMHSIFFVLHIRHSLISHKCDKWKQFYDMKWQMIVGMVCPFVCTIRILTKISKFQLVWQRFNLSVKSQKTHLSIRRIVLVVIANWTCNWKRQLRYWFIIEIGQSHCLNFERHMWKVESRRWNLDVELS